MKRNVQKDLWADCEPIINEIPVVFKECEFPNAWKIDKRGRKSQEENGEQFAGFYVAPKHF